MLRSPHVNKDSREQFEVRVHQRLLDVKNLTSQTVDRLMQLDIAAGVDVEVRMGGGDRGPGVQGHVRRRWGAPRDRAALTPPRPPPASVCR